MDPPQDLRSCQVGMPSCPIQTGSKDFHCTEMRLSDRVLKNALLCSMYPVQTSREGENYKSMNDNHKSYEITNISTIKFSTNQSMIIKCILTILKCKLIHRIEFHSQLT